MAFKHAGLIERTQTPREADLEYAREVLETITDELAAEGIMAKVQQFVDVSLVSGTYKYTLDSTVLDVVGDGMYIGPDEDTSKAEGERLVTWISTEEWHTISNKAAEGQPLRMHVHRELDDVQVWFWPIPDEAGTVRILAQRELADVDDGAATLDLGNYWVGYLTFELAHRLAVTAALGVDIVRHLASMAQGKLVKAKGKSYDLGIQQAVLEHETGWRM